MERAFYDIHCHAMNLSHPNFSAFIQRLKIGTLLFWNSIPGMSLLISSVLNEKINIINNLLSVMENDMGSFFLLMENCLKATENCQGKDGSPLLQSDGLHIGGNVYKKIVLTPLMMDFGSKGMRNNDIHYEKPNKPITEQVIDVFNGIKKYKNENPDGILEIYPFVGLNTKNYEDIQEIEDKILDKYFSNYKGSREALFDNMGKFDGNIGNIKSNFFAGVKVYPPLGFDPWPDAKNESVEFEKVNYLYKYCADKKIPITAHCSDGGFVIDKKTAPDYTCPSKWEKVLKEYPSLKLNLAHFGWQEGSWGKKIMRRFSIKGAWTKTILRLISTYENVYVDFSNRGVDDNYYNLLEKLMDEQPDKLKNRILFGTDFMINLMSIESYNKYLDIFSRNDDLTKDKKDKFCCSNPEQFLFHRLT